MVVRDFQDLVVWQKSVDLIVDLCSATRSFPSEERFGITAQLRRAAISIASNIAEGNGRGTTKDYIRFLSISRGSIYEVRSLLIVCQRLDFLALDSGTHFAGRTNEIGRMLSGLRASLKQKRP